MQCQSVPQVEGPIATNSVSSNEILESIQRWHRFFKACIAKHSRGGGVERDELVPLAVSAYNFFLCQSSKESPFILMFGRDPITPVAKLLEIRYYGERGSGLKLDTLRRLYAVVTEAFIKQEKRNQTMKNVNHTASRLRTWCSWCS